MMAGREARPAGRLANMSDSAPHSAHVATRGLARLLCGLLLLAPVACGNPVTGSATVTAEAGDPQIGTQVEAKSILDLYPQLLAGMKYVYLAVEKKGAVAKSTRVEAEVLETDADKAKVRLTIGGANSTTVDINRANPPVLPSGGLVFEGREQIGVPAGSFNARKYSYSANGSTFNVWAQQDVGVLRTLEQKANGDTVDNQLQSFSH